ncbi:MAG: hypothetical protein LC808_15935 [Actinobacteria bacterium]|nr:hypothetical protein [Actinomycetota bacterium]
MSDQDPCASCGKKTPEWPTGWVLLRDPYSPLASERLKVTAADAAGGRWPRQAVARNMRLKGLYFKIAYL